MEKNTPKSMQFLKKIVWCYQKVDVNWLQKHPITF